MDPARPSSLNSSPSCVYVSIGVDLHISFPMHDKLSSVMLPRSLRLNNDVFEPETRLESCDIIDFLVPLTSFWYECAADQSVHYAIVVLGLVPLGVVLVVIFLKISNYMIEAVP